MQDHRRRRNLRRFLSSADTDVQDLGADGKTIGFDKYSWPVKKKVSWIGQEIALANFWRSPYHVLLTNTFGFSGF